MEFNECQHLLGLFIESVIFADKAETSLRPYFLTHQQEATVSELAEYGGLKNYQQRKLTERDSASINLVNHQGSSRRWIGCACGIIASPPLYGGFGKEACKEWN